MDKQNKNLLKKNEANMMVKNIVASDLVLNNSLFNFEGLDKMPLDTGLKKKENPLKLIRNHTLHGHAVHTLNEFIQ